MHPSVRALGAALFAGGIALAGFSPALAEPEIGAVFQRPFMGATGTPVGAASEYLYFNTAVYADETVATDRGGSTALRFRDRTKLQVGASSTVVLDRFVYEPDGGAADAVISFSKGVFRFISGDIPEDSLRLETPSATLAIRGTKFVLAVAEDGRTDVWVIEGAVEAIPRQGAPATARAGQSLVITDGTQGVLLVDHRTAPHDPAVEDDVSPFAGPGGGDHDRASGGGSSGASGGNRSGGNRSSK